MKKNTSEQTQKQCLALMWLECFIPSKVFQNNESICFTEMKLKFVMQSIYYTYCKVNRKAAFTIWV